MTAQVPQPDILTHKYKLRLEAVYGDYVKYESLEENGGYKAINGVYIHKNHLPEPPANDLWVSFERA